MGFRCLSAVTVFGITSAESGQYICSRYCRNRDDAAPPSVVELLAYGPLRYKDISSRSPNSLLPHRQSLGLSLSGHITPLSHYPRPLTIRFSAIFRSSYSLHHSHPSGRSFPPLDSTTTGNMIFTCFLCDNRTSSRFIRRRCASWRSLGSVIRKSHSLIAEEEMKLRM